MAGYDSDSRWYRITRLILAWMAVVGIPLGTTIWLWLLWGRVPTRLWWLYFGCALAMCWWVWSLPLFWIIRRLGRR